MSESSSISSKDSYETYTKKQTSKHIRGGDKKVMKKSLSAVLASALVFGSFGSLAFADTTATTSTDATATAATYTTQQKYEILAASGIFNGINGEAALEANMTRAQFAKIIALVWGLEEAEGSDFSDAATKEEGQAGYHWAAGYIGAVQEAGLMNGYGDTFGAEDNVTIEQLAKVLVVALDLEIDEAATVEGATDWAQPYVAAAVAAGIIEASDNYAVQATRGDLVDSAFTAVKKVEADKVVYTVASAVAKDDKNVEVTFNDGGKVSKALTAALVPGVETSVTVEYKGKEYTAKVTLSLPDVTGVEAIANTVVEISLKSAITTIDAARVTIVDKDAAALEVKSATLSADGKSIVVKTAAQTANALYTLKLDGKEFKYVAVPVDTTAPKLGTVVAKTNTKVSATFDEALNETALNIANYKIDGLSVIKAEYATDEDDNIVKTEVILTTAAQTQGNVYKLVVSNVQDLAGNTVDADKDEAEFGGLPADAEKPELSSATAESNTTVKLVFGNEEELDKASAENIANYSISGLSVLKAELDENEVTLTTSAQTQGSVYKVVVTNVKDAAGNVINADDDEQEFGGLAPDTEKPELDGAAAVTNTTIELTFSEDLDEETAENIANYTISGLTVTKAERGSDDEKDVVTLTTSAQTQGTVYKAVVAGVKDVSGNVLDTDNDEAEFGGLAADTEKPELVSAISTGKNTVKLTFSEELDEKSAERAYNYYFGTELGYGTKAELQTNDVDVIVTTADQKNKLYTAVVTGVTDLSANLINADEDEADFGGQGTFDNTEPTVVSAASIDSQTIVVTFDEAMDETIAEAGANLDQYVISHVNGTDGVDTPVGTAPTSAKLSADGKSVKLQWAGKKFKAGVVYKVTVGADIEDENANGVDADDKAANFSGVSTSNAAPKVTSATLLNNQTLKITFSEAVSGEDAAAFTIAKKDGTPANFEGTVNEVVLSDDMKSITVYYEGDDAADKFVTKTLYTVAVSADVKDELGIVALSQEESDEIATFSGVSTNSATPKISSVVAVDENTVDVTFNQAVNTNLVDPADIVVYKKDGTTVVPAAIERLVSEESDTKIRIYFDRAFTKGEIYKIDFNEAKIENFNGKLLSADDDVVTFAAVGTKNAAPELASATVLKNGLVRVTFSEKVDGVAFGEFGIAGTATVATDIDEVDESTYDLTLNLAAYDAGDIVELKYTQATGTDIAGIDDIDGTDTVKFVVQE